MVITAPGAVEAAEAAREVGVSHVLLESDAHEKPGAYHLRGETASHDKPRNNAPVSDDIALLLHTSGTTARPKLVPLTHRNLCLSSSAVRETLRLTAGDRCLSFMPLFHIHGLVAGLLASISAGAAICCARGFQATSFFSWIESSQATWYTGVPTMHQAILRRAPSNSEALSRHKLRAIRSSSSPLFASVWEQLETTFGVPVVNAYGMTEAAHQIACVPLDGGKLFQGSVGRSTGPEITILDGSGSSLRAGEVGEVALRGAQIINAYLGPQEVNDRAFVNGWFRTGDQGFLDGNGALTLCGRIKELINSGGEKVSPYEVEETLLNHSAVIQAAVFAAPHELLGEQVIAAVVIRESYRATEKELLQYVSSRLARHKHPRRILIVDEIPGGATAKIQRNKLAAFFGLVPSPSSA
jgi:acyl-CoA synthetase (AMP-forming)/AMP-acid ligase II